jgi:hypothetical protein
MKLPKEHSPKTLPLAESDLVAEGGNVLATDDAPAPEKESPRVPTNPAAPRDARKERS